MFFATTYKLWLKYYPVFLRGLGGTLWISAVTIVFGSILGLIVAAMRMSRIRPLNAVASAYVEVLRGTPVLLQLYFFWIGLPKLFPALGMTDTQSVVCALVINASAYIILPQAVKNILPAMGNEFISTVKGTSLASTFFLPELITSYKTVQSATFLALQSLTIAGIIYFLLDLVLSWMLRLLERRLRESD